MNVDSVHEAGGRRLPVGISEGALGIKQMVAGEAVDYHSGALPIGLDPESRQGGNTGVTIRCYFELLERSLHGLSGSDATYKTGHHTAWWTLTT